MSRLSVCGPLPAAPWRRQVWAWAVLAVCGLVSPAGAQLPVTQVTAIFPPGGKAGTTIDVKILAGSDLDGVDRLVFSHAGITARQQTAPSPLFDDRRVRVDNTFEVTIAPEVPPGYYDVRAVGLYGASNPRAFIVGAAAEAVETPGNNVAEKACPLAVPSVMNATATAAADDWFQFEAREGQRIVLDLWAERIDSRLDGVMALYDGEGRELARSRGRHRRDPLIDFVAPADGRYLLQVFDATYAGGNEYAYRLEATTGPWLALAFPPAIEPGKKARVTLFGRNLPGGRGGGPGPSGAEELEQLEVEIEAPSAESATTMPPDGLRRPSHAVVEGFYYRLGNGQDLSNALFISLARAPVVVEQEPNDDQSQAQPVAADCEVVGQFWPRGDVDRFSFEARKGETLWIEVLSDRLGSGADPHVLLERISADSEGRVQASEIRELDDLSENVGGASFDTSTLDAAWRFAVPDDGTYRVTVRDLYYESRGSATFVYRLAIRRAQPDFQLVALSAFPSTAATDSKPFSTLVRRAGAGTVDVLALRRDGFDGEIRVRAEGLPSGLHCDEIVLGPGQSAGLLTLVAAPDAAGWVGPLRIVGRAVLGGEEAARVARAGAVVFGGAVQGNQRRSAAARLTDELVVAVSEKENDGCLIEPGEARIWETSRAGKLEIPIKLTRSEGFKGALTLSAVGLPGTIKAQPVTIKEGGNEGKLVLEVQPSAAVGRYSLALRGQASISYSRNPEAAEAAEKEAKELEKLAAELAKAAEEAKTNAESASKDAKADAEKVAAELAAKAKRAADARQAAAKRATDLAAAAKPKNVNVLLTSTTMTVAVAEAPLAVRLRTHPASLKAGGKSELQVEVERLYGYTGPVELEVIVPGGAKGLKAAKATIAGDQTGGAVPLEAGAEAATGEHELTLRARVRFNNQNLQIDVPQKVKVEPAS